MYSCHNHETSLKLLKRAVELNNQGIHAIIDQDDVIMATRSFADAVATLKAACIAAATASGNDCHFSAIGKKTIQEANLVAVPRMEVENPSSSFKLYNRFICLPSLSAAASAPNCTFKNNTADEVMSSAGGGAFGEMDQRIYASAILYNLGLAFQCQGSQPCLKKKAERIYNLVIQSMDDLTLLKNRLTLVITLGSINNLAHIWYSNGEYEKAREVTNVVPCFMLMKQQSSSSSSGEGGDNIKIFEDPELHGLLMNIMVLHAPTIAAAA